jgi:hypothetical protein
MRKLITLKDGFVTDIKDNFDVITGGCPTCGLDIEYISEITFDIYHNDKDITEYFEMRSEDFRGFEFSVAEILKLIVDNLENFHEMTIEEFKQLMEKIY